MTTKQKRGFAAMDKEKAREIARKGGQSHTREHMSRIGAIGGRKRKKT